MQEPKHTIKRQLKRFDDSYFWTKPCEHYGWLGSGVLDRNGKEIFEGDIVKLWDVFGNDKNNQILSVTYHDGAFRVGDGLLVHLSVEDIEVVGHIAEGTNHAEI